MKKCGLRLFWVRQLTDAPTLSASHSTQWPGSAHVPNQTLTIILISPTSCTIITWIECIPLLPSLLLSRTSTTNRLTCAPWIDSKDSNQTEKELAKDSVPLKNRLLFHFFLYSWISYLCSTSLSVCYSKTKNVFPLLLLQDYSSSVVFSLCLHSFHVSIVCHQVVLAIVVERKHVECVDANFASRNPRR